MISVKNLTKKYADATALKDLSFELKRGEILGLLGPNGAGKTTAIHILLGLLEPTSGEATVFGLSPLRHRHDIAQKLNFSSAYAQLPSNLKVSENLKVFSGLYGVKSPDKKIESLLSLFEIGPLRNRLTGALSAGEKTRLHLCKCLLNDPELLLLDEPTASLDPEMADKTRKLLKRIQKEKNIGILYTSHNMPEIEEVCDRVIFIHEGQVISRGTPDEVTREFESRSLEQAFIKIVRRGDLVWEKKR